MAKHDLISGKEFYSSVKNNDIPIVINIISETKNKLLNYWLNQNESEKSEQINHFVHQAYRAKTELVDCENNVEYWIGMYIGIVEVYNQLLQNLKDENALSENIQRLGGKSFEVLKVLNNNSEWISHGELASEINTSLSSLSNIMKRLLSSKAVKSVKVGKNVLYRITESGIRYYNKVQHTYSSPAIINQQLSEIKNMLNSYYSNTIEKESNSVTIPKHLEYNNIKPFPTGQNRSKNVFSTKGNLFYSETDKEVISV